MSVLSRGGFFPDRDPPPTVTTVFYSTFIVFKVTGLKRVVSSQKDIHELRPNSTPFYHRQLEHPQSLVSSENFGYHGASGCAGSSVSWCGWE